MVKTTEQLPVHMELPVERQWADFERIEELRRTGHKVRTEADPSGFPAINVYVDGELVLSKANTIELERWWRKKRGLRHYIVYSKLIPHGLGTNTKTVEEALEATARYFKVPLVRLKQEPSTTVFLELDDGPNILVYGEPEYAKEFSIEFIISKEKTHIDLKEDKVIMVIDGKLKSIPVSEIRCKRCGRLRGTNAEGYCDLCWSEIGRGSWVNRFA